MMTTTRTCAPTRRSRCPRLRARRARGPHWRPWVAPARRPPPRHPSCRATPVPSGTALYVNPCVQTPLGRPREGGALAPPVLPDPESVSGQRRGPLWCSGPPAPSLPACPSGCSGNSRCCVRVAALPCAGLRSSPCPHARSLFAQGLPAGVTGMRGGRHL